MSACGMGRLPPAHRAPNPLACGSSVLRMKPRSIIPRPRTSSPGCSRTNPTMVSVGGARLGWGNPIPRQIVAGYRRMKTNDATRPIFLGLGQGVAWRHNWYGRGSRNRHPEDYPRYLEGCDIASFDIYPVNHSRAEVAGNLWCATGGGTIARGPRDEKPVWNSVEVTGIYRPEENPPHTKSGLRFGWR